MSISTREAKGRRSLSELRELGGERSNDSTSIREGSRRQFAEKRLAVAGDLERADSGLGGVANHLGIGKGGFDSL